MHPIHHLKHKIKHEKDEPRFQIRIKECDSNNLSLILPLVFGIVAVIVVIAILVYLCYVKGKRKDHGDLMKEVAASKTDVELSTGLLHEHNQARIQTDQRRSMPRIFVHADSKDEEGKEIIEDMLAFDSSSSSSSEEE